VRVSSLCLIAIALVCVVAAMTLAPSAQGEEFPLQAGVTVAPSDEAVYGARVIACDRCIGAEEAVGAPDGRGAIVLAGGSVTLELARSISGCGLVVVWAAKGGWGAGKFRVYVSDNAETWEEIGGRTCTPHYRVYELDLDRGRAVRYVRIEHDGGWVSAVLVDALQAKGE